MAKKGHTKKPKTTETPDTIRGATARSATPRAAPRASAAAAGRQDPQASAAAVQASTASAPVTPASAAAVQASTASAPVTPASAAAVQASKAGAAVSVQASPASAAPVVQAPPATAAVEFAPAGPGNGGVAGVPAASASLQNLRLEWKPAGDGSARLVVAYEGPLAPRDQVVARAGTCRQGSAPWTETTELPLERRGGSWVGALALPAGAPVEAVELVFRAGDEWDNGGRQPLGYYEWMPRERRIEVR